MSGIIWRNPEIGLYLSQNNGFDLHIKRVRGQNLYIIHANDEEIGSSGNLNAAKTKAIRYTEQPQRFETKQTQLLPPPDPIEAVFTPVEEPVQEVVCNSDSQLVTIEDGLLKFSIQGSLPVANLRGKLDGRAIMQGISALKDALDHLRGVGAEVDTDFQIPQGVMAL